MFWRKCVFMMILMSINVGRAVASHFFFSFYIIDSECHSEHLRNFYRDYIQFIKHKSIKMNAVKVSFFLKFQEINGPLGWYWSRTPVALHTVGADESNNFRWKWRERSYLKSHSFKTQKYKKTQKKKKQKQTKTSTNQTNRIGTVHDARTRR